MYSRNLNAKIPLIIHLVVLTEGTEVWNLFHHYPFQFDAY
jgi:hypothetical protein